MVRIAVIAAALQVTASAAAQNIRFEIWIDGSVAIASSDGDDAVWDRYTLSCEAGCLDSETWYSISDAVSADVASVIGGLGVGALAFGEANASATTLGESSVAGPAVLPAHSAWSIGNPINGTASQIVEWMRSGVLTATASGRGQVWECAGVHPLEGIVCVPEPGGVSLAAFALLGALTARRRLT